MLAPLLRGRLRTQEPLSRHTSWRVGGPAARYYEPADADDLASFLAQLPPDEPIFWIGLGSNLLVRDGGLPGTVISTLNSLKEIEFLTKTQIRAEAGVPCAKVAKLSVQQGLTGAEFLAGIPGTMGGALAMNAGAFGGETWNVVSLVETVDTNGNRRTRSTEAYRVSYREVAGPEAEWFVAAHLNLRRDPEGQGAARIKDLLAKRAETQPMGLPSCGSVFRNPPGDYAARLIEACGLKGLKIGGAAVSEKHANFIINLGEARAADIECLIDRIIETVERVQSVRLRPEVRIVGVPGRAPPQTDQP
jgi:UDP-N-acetylmuramate dehydrogenase